MKKRGTYRWWQIKKRYKRYKRIQRQGRAWVNFEDAMASAAKALIDVGKRLQEAGLPNSTVDVMTDQKGGICGLAVTEEQTPKR